MIPFLNTVLGQWNRNSVQLGTQHCLTALVSGTTIGALSQDIIMRPRIHAVTPCKDRFNSARMYMCVGLPAHWEDDLS